MTDRKIMHQALCALTESKPIDPQDNAAFVRSTKAIEALIKALAQPEPFKPDWVSYRQGVADGAAQPKQEPVAVWELTEGGWDTIADADWMETLPIGTKLYTTPHSAKGSADSAETFGKPDIGLPDPCPQCRKGGVCRTPKCGRLQLPAEHPYRNQALAQTEQEPVAWMYKCGSDVQINTSPSECYGDNWIRTPLYTRPISEPVKERISEPLANQEPVAWITRRTGDGGVVLSGYETCEPTDYDSIPVYTAPPRKPWVGLTDDEIKDIWINTWKITEATDAFAYNIEAKLKEKNT